MPQLERLVDFYKFKIGKFKCISISDGSYDYDPLSLFETLTLKEIIENLSDYPLVAGKIRSPYTFLYVDTGNHKILADMGAGKLGPNTGNLAKNLKKAGISPEDIDTVFITHAHPDHIGGTLSEEGVPNYPNARYFMWKDEREFWFSEEAYKEVNRHLSKIVPTEVFMKVARGQLGPIMDRIELLTEETEIFPGVHVHSTPGHTPGHMAVSFSSDGEELYFVGDAIVFPFLIEKLSVVPVFDIIPDVANDTKRKLCDLLSEKKAWVLAQHFPPFPSLGHIIRKGNAYHWKPEVLT